MSEAPASSGSTESYPSANTVASRIAFEAVLAVCAIANIVPLYCARHLPMADLPEHLASMSTIRHYGDPAWRGAEHFTLAGIFETPYWLYHATGALLSVAMGSAERANVLLLSLVGLGYPYALRALLVALRRDPRLAIFGSALFWTTNLVVGLLNFVASVPVVLTALALVVRQAERPTVRRWSVLAALAIGIFYLHVSSFLLFLLQAALLTWMLPTPSADRPLAELRRRLIRLPARLSWLGPAAAICVAVLLAGRTVDRGRGPTMVWTSRLELVRRLHGWLFDTFHSPVDDVLGTGLVLALLALVILGRTRGASFEDRWRAWCTRVLTATAVLVWIGSPSTIGQYAFLIDLRMAVFVPLFAATLPTIDPVSLRGSPSAVPRSSERPTRIALAAAATFALGLSINAAYEVHAFERDDVAGFDELLRSMPHGKRLVMLNFERRSQHVKPNVFGYFGSYYRARYGGVASFSFSEMSHWPVQYRPGAAPPGRMEFGNPCTYRNQRDGAYFDYMLVHGVHDPLISMPSGPRWYLVGASRSWRLYKKSAADPGESQSDVPDTGPCG